MANDWKARVEAATVRLPKLGGQGVLVPGGIVLTACHCIEWGGDGAMALEGDRGFLEPIVTSNGSKFRMTPVAADPIADIAALMLPDNQEFDAEHEAFEAWEETGVAPVIPSGAFEHWCKPVEFGVEQAFGVHCLTHIGAWVSGRASRIFVAMSSSRAHMEFSDPILNGTSGGPIVDDAGSLVGIVSVTNEVQGGPCNGMQPIAFWALPTWVLARIGARLG